MDYPSESEESDVEYVPDEKGDSDDANSGSEKVLQDDVENIQRKKKNAPKRLSDDIFNQTRSKKAKGNDSLKNDSNEKTEIDHSTDKKRDDSLWASFLACPTKSNPTDSVSKVDKTDDNVKSDLNSSGSSKHKTENPKAKQLLSAGSKSKGGLSTVLNKIGKNSKLSTLEKSKLDWNAYKKDEGIEEELTTFNRGRDGYLERQDFLERTDLRRFEIEKNVRNSRRSII